MFNFRSDLSQLPSLHFLLISFTYVTVIKGVHLSFLVAGERTGIYTGALHKVPRQAYIIINKHGEEARCRMQYWTIFLVLFWILTILDGTSLFMGWRQSRESGWVPISGCEIMRGKVLMSARERQTKQVFVWYVHWSYVQTKGQHIQYKQPIDPEAEPLASFKTGHVKGPELWLVTSCWNMSLKAQLKGQKDCDLFWSIVEREASRTNEMWMNKRVSVGIKLLTQIGKPRRYKIDILTVQKKKKRQK